MERFWRADDDNYAALERRASRGCVVFADCTLPPGSSPARGRVGVEVNRGDGSIGLLVERVAYTGPEGAVAAWLRRGERRFLDMGELRDWVCGELRATYHEDAPPPALTDLDAVHDRLARRRPPEVGEQELFASLRAVVRGQDEALRTLARRVSRHLARVQPRRPLSVFALGPSGVGKTASAEALAATLARLTGPDPYGYLRLDMAEYQERHRMSQLLGAPPGYVGYGEGAELLAALAGRPRTVVVFDEIDKAHPHVLRTLMNAMDAGRLTGAAPTANGRTVDCRSAIFVFTSNLDATAVLLELDARDAFGHAVIVDGVCRTHLLAHRIPPELVGRVGAFLAYRDLDEESRAEIVVIAVATIGREYGVEVVEIDPVLVAELLEHGRNGALGARPDEYLVDEVLGGVLVDAARQSVAAVVLEAGSPPRWRAAR